MLNSILVFFTIFCFNTLGLEETTKDLKEEGKNQIFSSQFNHGSTCKFRLPKPTKGGHRKNKRKSTKDKHDKGDSRRKKEQDRKTDREKKK